MVIIILKKILLNSFVYTTFKLKIICSQSNFKKPSLFDDRFIELIKLQYLGLYYYMINGWSEDETDACQDKHFRYDDTKKGFQELTELKMELIRNYNTCNRTYAYLMYKVDAYNTYIEKEIIYKTEHFCPNSYIVLFGCNWQDWKTINNKINQILN